MGDLWLSCDVETDGPIPGPYSMLSLGICVAGLRTATRFEVRDPASATHYVEVAPISDQFVPEALAVSGLDRDRLVREGQEPTAAMRALADWVREVADGHRPVFVAWPLSFDWMFVHWYFERFLGPGSNPFGFSGAIDLKTCYLALSGGRIGDATKRRLPAALRSRRPHTHHALDDAMEQADLAAQLGRWQTTGARPA